MSCPATSSGLKAASTAILASPGRLKGLFVGADGTNAATAIIYDNPSAASGTVLCKIIVDAGATAEIADHMDVVANRGIYLALSGTGAEAVVHYTSG